MNPFLNPVFAVHILKRYLTDVNRAWRASPAQLKRYQNKALRQTLKYAQMVPLYQKKFQEKGIRPDKIREIDELSKLPLTTKADLINAFQDQQVPPGYAKEQAYIVGTSGSSGQPMYMFKDIEYIVVEALAAIRQLKAYGMSWRKTRITNIGDFSVPGTTDEESLKKGLMGNLSLFFSLKNYQHLYTGLAPRILIKKIDNFSPELIIGYTSVLMGLAALKNNGYGKNIKPQIIISSGEVLDNYSRKYIHEAFDVPICNLYATTEGGSIAFECLNKEFHINSDFVHVEVLDKHGENVEPGEFGNLVITRLFRGGTPILRYTGLDDIGIRSDEEGMCGMHTPLLKSLEGRKKDAIVLPDGKIFPPATFPMPLADAAAEFKTLKIERFQFEQRRLDDIIIRVKFVGGSKQKLVEQLIDAIKEKYKNLVGDQVDITVESVDDIKMPTKSASAPLIISHIDFKQIQEALL